MPEWWQIILTMVAGVGTGVLSGMFGIGGAIVSNPVLRALGASPRIAVGSTLPSIIPGALSGSLRYRREGLIVGRAVAWTGGCGIATSVGGAFAANAIPDARVLTIAIAAILAFTAVRIARSASVPAPVVAETDAETVVRTPNAPDTMDGVPLPPGRLAVTGLLAGGLSGLLGVGGGVLMVPLFTGWLRMPLKVALATSLACVGILAVPGTISHAALGHIEWAYALPLAAGIVPGAQLGARITIGIAERTLRLLVAVVLGAVAIVYAVTEVLALV